MKNVFKVENEEIVFRRANIEDNLEQIAELIYLTDPYIYPFWFNNSITKACKFLPNLLKEEGHLFSIDNFYIAQDKETKDIVGILCAVDKNTPLNGGYEKYKKINKRYRFTLERYIEELEKEISEYDQPGMIYISNICINPDLRGKQIGSKLIGYFISQMEELYFHTFALDCLLHNLRAKNLYHSMGFREMKEIVGFDGTEHSKVEVVSFLRKKGAYYPEEFNYRFLDIKKNRRKKK